MKKLFLILLAALLLLLSACRQSQPREDQIAFYYKASTMKYDPNYSPFQAEYRNSSDYETLEQALSAYFAGPLGAELDNPFPVGLSLISYREENGTLHLILDDSLAKLTGKELSIACCCIAKTCLGLTDAEKISISAENELLDGEKSITLSQDTMNLLDNSQH